MAEKRTMKELLETAEVSRDFTGELNEAASRSLARVHQHVQGRNIGIITAHRGGNASPEDRARNNDRNASLSKDISDAGYGYIHVRGRYIENHGTPHAKPVDEHSFMVIGKKGNDNGALKNFLIKHGQKYDQDSVLHKSHDSTHAHLHGTSARENSFPGLGKSHDVGEFHPNRAGEFHSVMKGRGKTFAFEDYSFWNRISFSSRTETLF